MKKLVMICAVVVMMLAVSSVAQAFVETFDVNPVLSNTQAPGTWYTDRSAPSGFVSDSFGGNSLKISIDGSAMPTDNFYKTQGRKYDTNLTGSVQTVSIDLFVGSDFNTKDKYTGIWATGFDSSNAVSAYPIIAFRNTTTDAPTAAGFYGYDNSGWQSIGMAVTDFDKWYNLKIVLTVGTGTEYFVNNTPIGTFADTTTVSLGNVILNTKNYGQSYDVYYDNFTVVPEPATMALLGLGGLLLRRKK